MFGIGCNANKWPDIQIYLCGICVRWSLFSQIESHQRGKKVETIECRRIRKTRRSHQLESTVHKDGPMNEVNVYRGALLLVPNHISVKCVEMCERECVSAPVSACVCMHVYSSCFRLIINNIYLMQAPEGRKLEGIERKRHYQQVSSWIQRSIVKWIIECICGEIRTTPSSIAYTAVAVMSE